MHPPTKQCDLALYTSFDEEEKLAVVKATPCGVCVSVCV